MKRTEENLISYKRTIKKIFEMSEIYEKDLLNFQDFSVREIYDYVKNLPFVSDPPNEETISRPLYTLIRDYKPRDCDDKTLILCAYARLKGIRFRICVIGENERPHHVYPEFFLFDEWVSMDATFHYMEIGKLKYKENFREVYEIQN